MSIENDDIDRLFRSTLQHDTAAWQPPTQSSRGPVATRNSRLLAATAAVGLAALLAVGAITLHSHLAAKPAPSHPGPPPVTATASPTPTPMTAVPTPVAVVPTAAGGPVPPGFVPVSGAGLAGGPIWLLGTAPCSSPPCTSIVRSFDGGQHWQGIPAPRTPLGGAGARSGVSHLVFADAHDGWAYGPELWVTHDGGAHWRQLSVPGGLVLDATVAGDELVVASSPDLASPQGTTTLSHGPVTGDLLTVTDRLVTEPSGQLTATSTGMVWFTPRVQSARGVLLVSSNGGGSWSTAAFPCNQPYVQAALAATGDDRLVLVCGFNGATGSEQKQVLTSVDGGQHWTSVAQAPTQGQLDGAAASGGSVVVASASGASFLATSGTGGASWQTTLQGNTGGTPWGSVTFLDATHVLAVTAEPQGQAGTAYLSVDAGLTWTRLTIRP